MSREAVFVAVALGVLGFGMLYAVKGGSLSSQWVGWIARASLAAGAAFAVGWLTLGLPGALVVEALLNTQALPSDSVWPLAIMVTLAGALAILAASLVLRVAMPATAGWAHAGLTAVLALLAMVAATFVLASGIAPR